MTPILLISRIVPLLIGYAFGCFPTGLIYGKAHGVDIREMGSGNIGMTNTLRNLGFKAGLITFIGDMGKAIAAIIISWLIFRGPAPEIDPLIRLYAGLGAIVGHNYSVFLKFKGGKGISCTVGMILGFAPWEIVIALALFFIVVWTTHYVSLGSILICLSFFLQTLIFGLLGFFPPLSGGTLAELIIVAGVITALGLFRHRENIGRLMSGTENKTYFSSKGKEKNNG